MIPAASELSNTFRSWVALAALLVATTSGIAGADWDSLPRGDWHEGEDSDLVLSIGAKNTLTFGGEHFTNVIVVKTRVAAQVRREYWCVIEEIEVKNLELKDKPETKKEAKPDSKTEKDTGEKKEAEKPKRSPEPLRLEFLNKGERLVLTIGYDAKKKKDVLEFLAFRGNEIAREFQFVRR